MADIFEKRLGAAIADMPNPVKDTKAYNYKYETLDQVLGIIQPALMAHGLFVIQGTSSDEEKGWTLSTQVIDMETDEHAKCLLDQRPLKFTGDSQKDGSAETYARRYALKTVFGLCGEDDDGAAASKKPAKERYAKPIKTEERCHEYDLMLQAFAEYVEITQEKKADAWRKFHGADVKPSDPEMALAVLHDIEAALGE